MWGQTQHPPESAPLVRIAKEAGLAFEASPTGRWIRLSGTAGVAYVVEDAWGDGCSLMALEGGLSRRLEHFLYPEPAVLAAAKVTGVAASSSRSRPEMSLASTG